MPTLRGHGTGNARHRRRVSCVSRVLVSGALSGTASALAAAWFGAREHGHAARPLNAVAHIYDGGHPSAHDGPGGRNTALGIALHMGAATWWAAFYETLFPSRPDASLARAAVGAATVAGAAYVVDYHVVGERFRPGFERHLPVSALVSVYAALAGGFVLATALRRLGHHQEKDRDEGRECRPAEGNPDAVKAPEALGQSRA